MKEGKTKIIILSLIIIIVLLLGIGGYIFLVQPALNGLVVLGQNQGVQYAVLTIAQQAATCQQVPLPIGNNQTLNIIAVDCLTQPAQ